MWFFSFSFRLAHGNKIQYMLQTVFNVRLHCTDLCLAVVLFSTPYSRRDWTRFESVFSLFILSAQKQAEKSTPHDNNKQNGWKLSLARDQCITLIMPTTINNSNSICWSSVCVYFCVSVSHPPSKCAWHTHTHAAHEITVIWLSWVQIGTL